MTAVIRFAAIFLLFYLVFNRMMIWMHVRMSGWQFIVFMIVLALMVEYAVEKMNR